MRILEHDCNNVIMCKLYNIINYILYKLRLRKRPIINFRKKRGDCNLL